MPKNEKICIIGNGGAAVEAVKALRENQYEGEIHLVSDSAQPAYNPMLTTYYVSGKIEFEAMFPYGCNMDLYEQYDVTLHLGSPVAGLDTKTKAVSTASGAVYPYDKCLVATGASPFLPPIEGMDRERVYTMRTVEDAQKLKEALEKKPGKALVIGASMVGIKVVELLYDAGAEVCLADMAPCLFPLAAHQECACVIENRLTDKGIRLRFGAGIEKILEADGKLSGYFSDGKPPEEADLIAVCIGVRPNLGFIDREQIEIDRGILVDDHMRTSDPDVYAAGDVAQGMNLLTGKKQIIGLWPNARYQGRTAGRNMAGAEDVYSGAIPHNITHFMHMVFSGFGDLTSGTRTETEERNGGYVQRAWNGSNLVGVNMLDSSCAQIGIIKSAVEKGLQTGTPAEFEQLCSTKLRDKLLLEHFKRA